MPATHDDVTSDIHSSDHWDQQVDLLILGTGAGGLAAAVTGANEGLSTLVLEKTEFLGGTTAYSAGTCWIPNNRFQRADGITDDEQVAGGYLDRLVGDRAPREVRESYLRNGSQAIDYFDGLGVRFWHSKTVVDYHPDVEGASLGGRALEPQTFDGRKLGKENFGRVRPPVPEFALFGGTMMVRRAEVNQLLTLLQGSPKAAPLALKLGIRWAKDRLSSPPRNPAGHGERPGGPTFSTSCCSVRAGCGSTPPRVRLRFHRRHRPGDRRRRRPPGTRVAGSGRPRRRAGRRRILRQHRLANAVPAQPDAAVHPGRGRFDRRHPSAGPGRRWFAQRAAGRQRVLVPQFHRSTPQERLDRGVPAYLGPLQAGASLRSTPRAVGSSTSRCPTTVSSAPCTPRTRRRRRSRPG